MRIENATLNTRNSHNRANNPNVLSPANEEKQACAAWTANVAARTTCEIIFPADVLIREWPKQRASVAHCLCSSLRQAAGFAFLQRWLRGLLQLLQLRDPLVHLPLRLRR